MSLHLTFDDGPSEWTPLILDLLAEHDVKATFFVIGQHVSGREALLRRIDEEGHEIGNHTWSHVRLTDLDDYNVWRQLSDTDYVISGVIHRYPSVWRAPFFGTDERVNGIAAERKIEHVGADVVPEDCFTDDADQIALRVIAGIPFIDGRPAVVSLHDGIPPDGGSSSCTQSRQPTVDAVRLILKAIHDRAHP